jgi:hypothetical protein
LKIGNFFLTLLFVVVGDPKTSSKSKHE